MVSVSLLEPDGLRDLLVERPGSDRSGRRRPALVVDCRAFTSYNAGHVAGAVNVHCPPIVRRRAGGRIPAVNVVRSAEALADVAAGRCRAVVVYDERSARTLDELATDSDVRLSLNSLAAVVAASTPLYLLAGIARSPNVYPALMLNSPRPPMFQNTDGIGLSKHWLSLYTSAIYITNITFYLMLQVPTVI